MRILVTGVAGFIGYHISDRLLDDGHEVLGVDSLNSYYNVNLKEARLNNLERHEKFAFRRVDISEFTEIQEVFREGPWDAVIHLAAQAGVRYSISNPQAYITSNLLGFANVLECCREIPATYLIYASSSSVYGDDSIAPFSEERSSDHPMSLYAATKRSNELLAYSYAHLYGMNITGLRFFSVYGPWGRPDMAYYTFTERIVKGMQITLFGDGSGARDYTYIDDVVESMIRLIRLGLAEGPNLRNGQHTILNIGNEHPVKLIDFVLTLEKAIGVPARIEFAPRQPGEVLATFADTTNLRRRIGFAPSTSLSDGVARFVTWYTEYSAAIEFVAR